MIKYKKIFLFLLFAGFFLSASAEKLDFPVGFHVSDSQQDKTSLEVIINGTTKIQMENIPMTGYLEVYSILGVKVTSVNLKTCLSNCTLDLPKGIYILKAGKVAQKVIVR